ncbi:MAG TPA: class I SAM-dependent methyltransferase [Mycobacteriales bacterium]|nr:class I SAM-dependent methyltransferase [Mycobacteriales bacterium]
MRLHRAWQFRRLCRRCDSGAHAHRPPGLARASRAARNLRLDRTGVADGKGGSFMATPTTGFDPDAYKKTTTEQWQIAAQAWHDWTPTIEAWLADSTERMLTMARIGPGHRVLDVAAGTGGQSIAAARRVGPDGRVLATDIAPRILEFAEAEALAAGLSNIATRVCDGEDLAVETGHFDAVISRLGLIYLPDRARGLAEAHRALRPGGRYAAIVFSGAERNRFFSVPVTLIRERAQLPPPAPGQPGPFSLSEPGVIEAELEAAGFTEVETERCSAPIRLPDAATCTRFERESFGALHQMMSGLDESDREALWAEIATALTEFEGSDGFVGECELIVAAGTKA